MNGLYSYRIRMIIVIVISIMMVISISCRSDDKKKLEAYDSFNLGVKAVKADNIDLAGHYFKKAVILNPDFTEARLNLANVDFLNGNLDKARDEYSKLLKEKVYDPRLLFNLGWIYLMQENYETAGELFRKSRRVDPSFTDSDYGLAMLAHSQNEDSLTRFHLQQYLENSPYGRWSNKANEVLNSITPVNIETSNLPDKPEESLPETTITKPDEVPMTNQNEITITDNQPKVEETKEPEKKPVHAKPRKTTSQLISEGTSALNNKEYSTAENRFKQALRQDSKSIEASRGLAKLYFIKGKGSLEEKYVKQYVKSSGGNSTDGVEIAGGFEAIGDYHKAIEYYRNYLKNNPFGSNAAKAKEKLTELDSKISE